MIDVVKEIERSERRGKKAQGVFNTSKVVVGTKRDRKRRGEGPRKADFKKLESIRIKEVSALTNQGVGELFKQFIKEIHDNPILHFQIHNMQKQKNKED